MKNNDLLKYFLHKAGFIENYIPPSFSAWLKSAYIERDYKNVFIVADDSQDVEKDNVAAGVLSRLGNNINQAVNIIYGSTTLFLAWISSLPLSLLELVGKNMSSCLEFLHGISYWFFSCITYPFTWLMMVIMPQKLETTITDVKHTPTAQHVVVNTQKMSNSIPNTDINLPALMESSEFLEWKNQVEAALKNTIPIIPSTAQDTKVLEESLQQHENQNSGHFQALSREIRNLHQKIHFLQAQHRQAALARKLCCDKFDDKVLALLAGLYGEKETMSSADLIALIKDRSQLLNNLEASVAKLSAEFAKANAANKVTDDFATNSHHLSDAYIRNIVKEALAYYDADKTNMVDYALESSGATILSTRCTENYDYRRGETFYFGLSWFSKEYRPNNPRTIIQPNMQPGECWAFKGATGYVVIELSATIKVTAVTLEHIPRSISPNGSIASAPRDFSVWGLTTLKEPEPFLLGKFRYEDNGESLQTFHVEVEHDNFSMLELRIESNHGHIEYTCVYRFRVHGVPA